MSIFEAGMIICFGLAWPTSIIKSIKSKSTKGKSVGFLFIVLSGYVAGIIHKLVYSKDLIIIFYILNFIMVLTDILFYFRNKKLEEINN